MAKTSGFALVKGSAVQVLVGTELREAMGKAIAANRYAPLERTRVAKVTFEYAGAGKVENVRVGKIVY